MKLRVQLFVPNSINDTGNLVVDTAVDDICSAVAEVESILRWKLDDVGLVERSMIRVQSEETLTAVALTGVANTVLILYVRNGQWEPYRFPFFFNTGR